jgi:restriction endonuclease S subunit
MTSLQQSSSVKKFSKWRTEGARVNEEDLAVLNKKVELNGFNNFNEFVHAWIRGEYPRHENNEQVDKMLQRFRDKDIRDPLTREFSPTFYRNVNLEDMLKDLSTRYIYKKHAKDLVRYFERYGEIFFTKGSVEKIAKIPNSIIRCNISQNLIGIGVNHKKINSNFLLKFLQLPKVVKIIVSGSNTTTFKSIQLRVLRSLEIPLPTEQEQEKIVDYLNTVDERFEQETILKSQYEILKKGLIQNLLTGKIRVEI